MIEIADIRKNLHELKDCYRIIEIRTQKNPKAKVVFMGEYLKIIEDYEKCMQSAPLRLQLAYENLYRCYKTQKQYAIECGITEKYIQILNKRIILHIYNILNKE